MIKHYFMNYQAYNLQMREQNIYEIYFFTFANAEITKWQKPASPPSNLISFSFTHMLHNLRASGYQTNELNSFHIKDILSSNCKCEIHIKNHSYLLCKLIAVNRLQPSVKTGTSSMNLLQHCTSISDLFRLWHIARLTSVAAAIATERTERQNIIKSCLICSPFHCLL